MEMMLSQLKCGKIGVIKRLEGGQGFQRRLRSLGIRLGKKLTPVSCQPFRGPIVIKVDGMKIVLGRGMANKIIVEVQ